MAAQFDDLLPLRRVAQDTGQFFAGTRSCVNGHPPMVRGSLGARRRDVPAVRSARSIAIVGVDAPFPPSCRYAGCAHSDRFCAIADDRGVAAALDAGGQGASRPQGQVSGHRCSHSHHRSSTTAERIDRIVREMDELNLRMLVNLSGRYGERLKSTVERFVGRHPSRGSPSSPTSTSEASEAPVGASGPQGKLEADVNNGASGLKFFKNFGMTVKDHAGKRGAGGRSFARTRLEDLRPVEDPGVDSRCRAGGILQAARSIQ